MGKIPWDNPDRPLRSGWTPREKNRAKRISLGVENSEQSPSEENLERYGALLNAHKTQSKLKWNKKIGHKNKEDYSLGRRNMLFKTDRRLPSESVTGVAASCGLVRIPRNYSKGENLNHRKCGAKNDEQRDDYYVNGPRNLKEPK